MNYYTQSIDLHIGWRVKRNMRLYLDSSNLCHVVTGLESTGNESNNYGQYMVNNPAFTTKITQNKNQDTGNILANVKLLEK